MNRNIYRNLLIFISGLCIGGVLLWGIFVQRDQADTAPTESVECMEPGSEEISESAYAETVVDYPFFSGEEGWSLVLRESGAEDAPDGESEERKFCLYDENGQLLQAFPCGIAAEELVFRFDRLSHYYGYDADLIVFPAGVPETGTEGLCYSWDDEKRKFIETPIRIPWYQEDRVKDQAFMTVRVEENEDTNVICRINEGSREVVELRKWTLRRNEETGKEILHIWDCLERHDIYYGKVERNALGNLMNDKYYQYLFWSGLEDFWSCENDSGIETEKSLHGNIETCVYADKEAFLADCGFAQEETFYKDYDRFHNMILELYFNPRTGEGCGIRYIYNYNYDLEKVVRYKGFVFDEVETRNREPEDVFSTLSIVGTDARAENVSGYSETYEYTDEGRLSYFASRGTIVGYGEGGPGETKLLSMDYYYRDGGTLYYKEYYHHHILFGTPFQWQLIGKKRGC